MAYSIAGLAAVGAQCANLTQAARLWGSVIQYEQASGKPLHKTERQRYERVLAELERRADTAGAFAQGKEMALDTAVDYALATVA